MKNKLNFLTGLLISLFYVTDTFAISRIKVICDGNNEKIYLDGEYKAECDYNEPIYLYLKEGKHKIEIKKINNDGSLDYYSENFEINDKKQKTILVKTKQVYSEKYFIDKIKKNINVEQNCWDYLNRFPNGKYKKYIINKIKKIYADKCNVDKLSIKLNRECRKFSSQLIKLFNNSWEKIIDTGYSEFARSIIQTIDKNFIVAGYIKGLKNGYIDALVIKLDKKGNIVWKKTFGGYGVDEVYSIVETIKGNFLIVGKTQSTKDGKSKVWIIKLDKNGNKIWEKTFSKGKWSEAYFINHTKEKNYIITGYGKSPGKNDSDVLLMKINQDGKIIWSKLYDINIDKYNKYDEGYSVSETKNENLIVTGYSANCPFILYLDKNGNIIWKKSSTSCNEYDVGKSIIETSDGNFIYGGGNSRFYLFKINKNGNIIWERKLGMREGDEVNSIIETKNKNIIAVGVGHYGDGCIIKLDKNGNKIWEKTFGGKDWDEFSSVIELDDGSLVIAGNTWSKGAKKSDFWILKLDKNLLKLFNRSKASSNIPSNKIAK